MAATNSEREKLMQKYGELQQQLTRIGYICNGTVMSLYRKCGKPNCGCKETGQLQHGPYHIWTRKQNGKTITRSLTEEQSERCLEYIRNFKHMESIIAEMKEISALMITQRE